MPLSNPIFRRCRDGNRGGFTPSTPIGSPAIHGRVALRLNRNILPRSNGARDRAVGDRTAIMRTAASSAVVEPWTGPNAASAKRSAARRLALPAGWPGPEAQAGSSVAVGEWVGREGLVHHQELEVGAAAERVEGVLGYRPDCCKNMV
jgi:hypothetical protein